MRTFKRLARAAAVAALGLLCIAWGVNNPVGDIQPFGGSTSGGTTGGSGPSGTAQGNVNWNGFTQNDTTGSVTIADSLLTTGPLYSPTGTAAAPTQSFSTDHNSGAYSAGAGTYAISAGGVQRVAINSSALMCTVPIESPAGTASSAGVQIGTGAGLYQPATNQLAIATNSNQAFLVDANQNAKFAGRVLFPAGNANTLAWGFSNDTNNTTGVFSSGVGFFDWLFAGVTGLRTWMSGGLVLFKNTNSGSSQGFQFQDSSGHVILEIDGAHGLNIQSGGLSASPISQGFSEGTGTIGWTGASSSHDSAYLGNATGTTTLSGGTTTSTVTIPAASIVLGTSVRVNTAITGATGFSLGDGTTAAAFGSNLGVAVGTTASTGNWTITSAPVYPTAKALVFTAVGGSFTGGVVRTSVFFVATTVPVN